MMPSSKSSRESLRRKHNARFPAGRIKKIMQTDEDVGKVQKSVPVIISRALELFVESLLTKAVQVTNAKNAKTLTPSHMRTCILSESRFDFLKDLVSNISEVTATEDDLAPSASHPGTPVACYPPAPKRAGVTRGRGRGRSASTPSAGATSLRQRKTLTSSLPSTPTTPTAPCPSFYTEIPIGAGPNPPHHVQKELTTRPPVIHHTGPSIHCPLPQDSGDEEEEEEVEDANGYHLTHLSARPLLIDDDYDT